MCIMASHQDPPCVQESAACGAAVMTSERPARVMVPGRACVGGGWRGRGQQEGRIQPTIKHRCIASMSSHKQNPSSVPDQVHTWPAKLAVLTRERPARVMVPGRACVF